ncbi:hypothetical protein HGRIS_013689 [Hohenbuehelia grisea]|uniref:Uncharacterized protein n=1 Tax=Hohenbuehelia grisea TaxID=104357 RepID=A0ABR3IW51_9AGAR
MLWTIARYPVIPCPKDEMEKFEAENSRRENRALPLAGPEPSAATTAADASPCAPFGRASERGSSEDPSTIACDALLIDISCQYRQISGSIVQRDSAATSPDVCAVFS